MAGLTPNIEKLVNLAGKLSNGRDGFVFRREIASVELVAEALKVAQGAADAPKVSQDVASLLRRNLSFLERVSFVGPTEKLLFTIVYGADFLALRGFLATPRLAGHGANLKVILDEHIYSGGLLRKELSNELTKTQEYLYGQEAQKALESRILRNYSGSHADWETKYPKHREIWQSQVDELWLSWELGS